MQRGMRLLQHFHSGMFISSLAITTLTGEKLQPNSVAAGAEDRGLLEIIGAMRDGTKQWRAWMERLAAIETF